MKRFLITTALEESWRDDRPVLFLGEWCKRYSLQDHWAGLDAETLPYHWDDRRKLERDYAYLNELYERLLPELAARLNQLHGADRSVRYWRILAGPWLGCFTQALFDRWSSVEAAASSERIAETLLLADSDEDLVPNDMSEFRRLYVGDEWNHLIFASLIRRRADIPFTQQSRRSWRREERIEEGGLKDRIKRKLMAAYARAAGLLTTDDAPFLLATSLPSSDELRLYRRLGRLPQLWRSQPAAIVGADSARRRWSVGSDEASGFEVVVRSLLPKQIPTAYLEGYRALTDQVARLPWPERPSVILASTVLEADDVFKAWAADKVERGSPLVVGQHGGNYGIGRWSFAEDHEMAIGDRYLSWGWSEPSKPHVVPVGQLKSKRPLGVDHAKQSGALMVTAILPRYSYYLYSVPVARQWLDYFEDQCAFIDALPDHVRHALIVRVHPTDFGWDQRLRWKDRFPSLRLDDGRWDISGLVARSRLYISTYNATTFLESFSMDVPSVIYWRPEHWELRPSALPYFEELKSAAIFHDDPRAAARHVAAIWDDVGAWWSSPAVRHAVGRFKARYCDVPDDLLPRVETALRKAS